MDFNYKLSICMIVKNEEANLSRCLDSFLPIINMKNDDTLAPQVELIIVDTGSTDRTIKVARKYTDKVFEKSFIPWDFSAARNYGIAMATGEHIMIVDADEELTQSSVYILMDAVLNPANAMYKTIFIMLRNFYSTKTGEYASVMHPRVFPNTGGPLYQFAIHNKPDAQPPYLFLDNVIFNHYGYMFDKPELFTLKKTRSLPMLEAEYEKNPEDLHILTHLIKTYYAANMYGDVVKHGEDWIKLMRKVEYHEGWFAYLEVFANMMGAYCALKDTKAAERVLKESKRYSNKLISLNLILGQHYLERKKYGRARELFEDALLVSQTDGSPYEMLCNTNTAVIMPEIMNYLSLMCFIDGDDERAGNLINEGIRLNENRLPLRWDIFNERDARRRLKMIPFKRKKAS